MKQCINTKRSFGLTLLETVIAIAFIGVVSFALYEVYTRVIDLTFLIRTKTVAAALANEQFEIMRNLPYHDVGTVGGVPSGKLPQQQTLVRNGKEFDVTITIRNIDLPFDGTLGGTPNDTSPADNKLAQIEVLCDECRNFNPISFSTRIAPKGLETTSDNGSLMIQVFNASGQSIQGANVHVENNSVSPAVSINDTTNNSGLLTIVDAIPDVEGYEITVTKSGFSTDQTHASGTGNPNPLKPHAIVVQQQITQTSFAIDEESSLDVTTVNKSCNPTGSVSFDLEGSKLIGTNPDILKYDVDNTTNMSGSVSLLGLEWDSYTLTLDDETYELVGTDTPLPISVLPDTSQSIELSVAAQDPSRLFVSVVDQSTGLPIPSVDVSLTKTGFSETYTTGEATQLQTDWSGGASQQDFVDSTKYLSGSFVDTALIPGSVLLELLGQNYASSGSLISSTFDFGTTVDYHTLSWNPTSQPGATGPNSVQFQIATNSDNSTWNFVGPDGTDQTFFTNPTSTIPVTHDGNRYLRYQVFLSTADTLVTPTVDDITMRFTTDCTPEGQTSFRGLSNDTYMLSVTKSGYAPSSQDVTISAPWQSQNIQLTPSP